MSSLASNVNQFDNTYPGSRRGMTLIEVLVVIAIMGILASLLLPTIFSSRESARQLNCQSNLRQIGVAIGGYTAQYRRLPYGCLEWRDLRQTTGRQLAWSATILPFLDAEIVANELDLRKAFDHPDNAEAAATVIPVYLCPSLEAKKQVRGPTDYSGIFGQRITTRSNTDNGVLVYNKSFTIMDIKDGLANTIVVSEDSAGPDSEWINGRNVLEQSSGINDPRAWIGDNEIRSKHTGGAMTVFCDGTTRFLSNTIDKKTLAALITRAGKDIAKIEN